MGEFVWVDDCDIKDEIATVVNNIFSVDEKCVHAALPENLTSSIDRGSAAIKMFKEYLEVHFEAGTLPKGIILDIQIPVPSLSYFDARFGGIPTNNGADTGFQLAKFILHNYGKDGENESLYGDYFKGVPVLFLSISNFDRPPDDYRDNRNPYTKWMKDSYKDISDIQREGKKSSACYFHLLKRDMRKEADLLSCWLRWCGE